MRTTLNHLLAVATRLVAAIILVSVAACQSPPPAPVPAGFSPEQQQVLRSWGFQEGDDAWTLQSLGTLLFEVDSDKLLPELRTKVDTMGRSLSSVGIERLRVEGHTDDQGAQAYNQELSERRARAVAQVLIDAGFASEQVLSEGFGFSRPLQKDSSEASRKENRRVAIVVPVP